MDNLIQAIIAIIISLIIGTHPTPVKTPQPTALTGILTPVDALKGDSTSQLAYAEKAGRSEAINYLGQLERQGVYILPDDTDIHLAADGYAYRFYPGQFTPMQLAHFQYGFEEYCKENWRKFLIK